MREKKYHLKLLYLLPQVVVCALIVLVILLVSYETLVRGYFSPLIYLFLLSLCLFFLWYTVNRMRTKIIVNADGIMFASAAFSLFSPWHAIKQYTRQRHRLAPNRWQKIPVLILKEEALPGMSKERPSYRCSWYYRFLAGGLTVENLRQLPLLPSIISKDDLEQREFGRTLRRLAPEAFVEQGKGEKKQKFHESTSS